MLATKMAKEPFQYEALVTPSSWRDVEQRFSFRLTQIIDDVYQKYSALRQKTKNEEPSTPTDEPVDADTLNGKTADDFLAVDGTAVNAEKLGGKPPEVYATKESLEQYATKEDLENIDIPTGGTANVAYNLLDNSNFKNPVNQRGFVSGNSVSSWEYFLDRWINASDAARVFTLTDNGMVLEADTTLCQKLEGVKSGTVLTFAACLSDGTIATVTGTVTYNSDNSWLRVASGNIDGFDLYIDTYAGLLQAIVYTRSNAELRWVALYEGEYTAETLPTYVPKGYAVELLECQRFFFPLNPSAIGIGNINASASAFYAPILLPVQMRTISTVQTANNNYTLSNNGTQIDVTSQLVLNYQKGNNVQLALNVNGKGFNKSIISKIWGGSNNTYVCLNAEL